MNFYFKNIANFLIIIWIFSIQLIAENNDSFNLLINKGDSLYKKFEIVNALMPYKQAYEIKPGNYYSLYNISKIYNAAGELKRKDGDKEEAKIYFNKAVDLSNKFISLFPDSSSAYTNLAVSYGNLAKFVGGKERITYARRIEDNAKHAIKLNSKNPLPYIILGAYFREIAKLNWVEKTFANILYGDVPDGSLEDSEKMLKTALRINPNIITANFQMALTYREMGIKNEEKNYFNKVLTLPTFDFRDPYLKKRAQRILANLN